MARRRADACCLSLTLRQKAGNVVGFCALWHRAGVRLPDSARATATQLVMRTAHAHQACTTTSCICYHRPQRSEGTHRPRPAHWHPQLLLPGTTVPGTTVATSSPSNHTATQHPTQSPTGRCTKDHRRASTIRHQLAWAPAPFGRSESATHLVPQSRWGQGSELLNC